MALKEISDEDVKSAVNRAAQKPGHVCLSARKALFCRFRALYGRRRSADTATERCTCIDVEHLIMAEANDRGLKERGRTVLVVDDEASVREFVDRALTLRRIPHGRRVGWAGGDGDLRGDGAVRPARH